MLLDRAAALTDKIVEYEKIKSTAHEAQYFQTRAVQFAAVANQLTLANQTLCRLRAAGIPASFTPSEGMGQAQKAATLRMEVAKDPNVLAEPPFDLKYAFSDRLSGIATAAKHAAAKAWREWVETKSNLGSEDVLNALSALPQFRTSIATIRQCRGAISALASSAPVDPVQATHQVDALVEAHQKAWSTLTAEDIPQSVLGFIRACAGDGASIEMLSDEVLDWLKSRSLTSAFRIKIR